MGVGCEGHAAQITIGKGDGNIKVRVTEIDNKDAKWIRVRRDPVAELFYKVPSLTRLTGHACRSGLCHGVRSENLR